MNNTDITTFRIRYFAIGILVLAGIIIANPHASAQIQVDAGVGGAPNVSGVTYVNFDSVPLGGGTNVPSGAPGLSLSFTGTGQVVNGSVANAYAAPYLSGSNGAGFGPGGSTQPAGIDQTNYITAGVNSVTMIFTSPQEYLGILWGSVDTYNTLTFYNGAVDPANIVGTFTGSQISTTANGNQGVNGTYYVNFDSLNPSSAFTNVVATSSQYAFEFDNVAFSPDPVGLPEPATYALLLSGLLTVGLFKHRRVATV